MSRKAPEARLLDQLAVDRRAVEGQIGQLLDQRQLGEPHLVVDRSRMLGRDLGLQQRADDVLDALVALDARRDDLVVGRAHAGELQLAHQLQDLRALHGRLQLTVGAAGRRSGHSRRAAATAERQPLRRQDRRRRLRLLPPCQRIEDHVGAGDAGVERFRACRLDGSQAVGQHGGQDLDHLPVAVVAAGELAAHASRSIPAAASP